MQKALYLLFQNYTEARIKNENTLNITKIIFVLPIFLLTKRCSKVSSYICRTVGIQKQTKILRIHGFLSNHFLQVVLTGKQVIYLEIFKRVGVAQVSSCWNISAKMLDSWRIRRI